jgi:hypothetical protein
MMIGRPGRWRIPGGALLLLLLALSFGLPAAAAADGPAPERLRATIGACTIEAPADQADTFDRLVEDARQILPRVERELGTPAMAPYRILLIPPGTPADPEIAALDAAAPYWAAGFLLPAQRVGAIRMRSVGHYPHGDLSAVFTHEVTHMLMRDAAGDNMPRWFSEGVATGIERAWGLRDIFVYSSSLLTGSLPRLEEMDRAFLASSSEARRAYASSFDFVLWARREHGENVVSDVLRRAATLPFPAAWAAATGDTLASSEASWRRGSLLLYRWVPALTGTTTLWIVVTLLTFVAAARRRARSRAILESWDAEDGIMS